MLALASASCNVCYSNFMLIQKDCASAMSIMPFQNGVIFQMLIVAAKKLDLVLKKAKINQMAVLRHTSYT